MKKSLLLQKMPMTFILSACIGSMAWADWTDDGKDPAYPKSVYLTGVGASVVSQAEADKIALVEVQRQISMNIKSVREQKSTVTSQNGGAESEDYYEQTRSRLTVKGDVNGAQVVKKTKKNENFMSYAVLDKSQFASLMMSEIKGNQKEMLALKTKIEKNIQSERFASIMSDLRKIKSLADDLIEKRKLLSAVDALDESSAIPFAVGEVEEKLDAVLKQVKVADKQNLEQKVSLGETFQKIKLKVLLQGKALSGFEWKIVDEKNKTVKTVFSDDSGWVEVYPASFVNQKSGSQKYKLMPGMDLSANAERIVAPLAQDLVFEKQSPDCLGKISYKNTELSEAQKVSFEKYLNEFGLRISNKANQTFIVQIQNNEEAAVQGFSGNSSFKKTKLQLSLVGSKSGSEFGVIEGEAIGIGSGELGAFSKALQNLKFTKGPEDFVQKCLSSSGAKSQDKNELKVAVLPFEYQRSALGFEDVVQNVEDYLMTEFDETTQYVLLERAQLNKVLNEQALQNSGIGEQSVELGKLLGADCVVVGSVKSLKKGNIEVSARLVSVKTGQILRSAVANGGKIQVLKNIAQKLGL